MLNFAMLGDSFHRAMAMEMDDEARASEARFITYVESLAQVLDHADRAGPLKEYCTGLLMPFERKSVEPMAAVVAPSRVSAEHQSLLHFVGQAAWSDEAVLARVRELVLPAMEAQGGPIEAWIVDDTGFAKKGVHSVGVGAAILRAAGQDRQLPDRGDALHRQSRGKPADGVSICISAEDWAGDAVRRKKAGVPDEVRFKKKPEIALAQIAAALAAGVGKGVVLADAGLRHERRIPRWPDPHGIDLCGGRAIDVNVWPPGVEASAAGGVDLRVRRAPRGWREQITAPVSAKTSGDGPARRCLAGGAPGARAPTPTLSSRFAALRVRPAYGGLETRRSPHRRMAADRMAGRRGRADEILALDPARGHRRIEDLVDTAKLRWRIERDYEELKSELGLAHFEGRGWRGFHHHATLCIAAYGFLIRERAAIPPSAPRRREKPSPSRPSTTPRRRRSDPSGTSRTRSPPCESA